MFYCCFKVLWKKIQDYLVFKNLLSLFCLFFFSFLNCLSVQSWVFFFKLLFLLLPLNKLVETALLESEAASQFSLPLYLSPTVPFTRSSDNWMIQSWFSPGSRMGGCIPFLKAARAHCPKIILLLLLLSAFIFLVSVLGGAPGQNPDRKMDMVSIHSLSELERLKLQETAYHELMARHFLSDFKPDRGELYPERSVFRAARIDPRAGWGSEEVLEGEGGVSHNGTSLLAPQERRGGELKTIWWISEKKLKLV